MAAHVLGGWPTTHRLQRRDLQLPRTAGRTGGAGAHVRFIVGHGSTTRSLQRMGNRGPDSPRGHVRLRPARSRPQNPPPCPGLLRHQAALLLTFAGGLHLRIIHPWPPGDGTRASSSRRRGDVRVPPVRLERSRRSDPVRRHQTPPARPLHGGAACQPIGSTTHSVLGHPAGNPPRHLPRRSGRPGPRSVPEERGSPSQERRAGGCRVVRRRRQLGGGDGDAGTQGRRPRPADLQLHLGRSGPVRRALGGPGGIRGCRRCSQDQADHPRHRDRHGGLHLHPR